MEATYCRREARYGLPLLCVYDNPSPQLFAFQCLTNLVKGFCYSQILVKNRLNFCAYTLLNTQDLGSYIVIGNSGSQATGISLTGCKVDNSDATCYTIGSTKKDHSAVFSLNNTTSRDYYFSFYSSSKNVATQAKFVLSNGSGYSVEKTFDISKTGDWSLTEYHICKFESVPTGDLTLTMTFVSESSDYMGNYGNI